MIDLPTWAIILISMLSSHFGASALQAIVPAKYRAYLPLFNELLNWLALNVKHAKNADGDQPDNDDISQPEPPRPTKKYGPRKR